MTLLRLSVAGLYLMLGQMANSATIGAYAVGDHSRCSAGGIPGTIRELNKFFAHPDLPLVGQKNFYWTDTRVHQTNWTAIRDNFSSTETSTGLDGADSSLLTYIASHGVTTNGKYSAYMGSQQNGGCKIPSTAMELGNHSSKYVILSTCQGLKIGNGDYPQSPGENPSVTWKNPAKGLNCILGYSNNMADEDSYGVYLLDSLKEGTSTLAEAFMSASEAVSPYNIPAVLCFGKDQADAEEFIRTNKNFSDTTRSFEASAYVYRETKKTDGHLKDSRENFPATITLEPVKFDVQKAGQAFIGSKFSTVTQKSKGVTLYSSDNGLAQFNAKTNVLTIKNNINTSELKSTPVPELDESIQIASNALNSSGIKSAVGDLRLDYSSEDVIGGKDGAGRILTRKLVFKQKIAGFHTLGQAGSVELTIGAGGVINNVKTSLFRSKSASKRLVNAPVVSASSAQYEETALERVAKKVPGGTYEVTSVNFGYDAGNFFEVNPDAPAVAEVIVEVTHGEVARRYIEKISL
jgi:hypothetical protein